MLRRAAVDCDLSRQQNYLLVMMRRNNNWKQARDVAKDSIHVSTVIRWLVSLRRLYFACILNMRIPSQGWAFEELQVAGSSKYWEGLSQDLRNQPMCLALSAPGAMPIGPSDIWLGGRKVVAGESFSFSRQTVKHLLMVCI